MDRSPTSRPPDRQLFAVAIRKLCGPAAGGRTVGIALLGLAATLSAAPSRGLPSEATASRPGGPGDGPTSLALVDVEVITMVSEQVLHGQTVLIHDGRIREMGPKAEIAIPEQARVIDGAGRFLLPGLVDLHVHLDEGLGVRPDFADGPLYLAHGVTTVLNLRGDETHLDWRRRIEEREILAPNLYTSGPFLNEPFVTTPDEVEREVRREVRAGFDVIKFHEVFSPEERRYVTTVGLGQEAYDRMHAVARAEGIPVVGHAPHGLGLSAAVENGQVLAHLNTLVEHYLLPDGSPTFVRMAHLTKWAALSVMFLSLLVLGTAVAGKIRRPAARFPALGWLGSASLGAAGLFLFVWEHIAWAGDDRWIATLWACGLGIVGSTGMLSWRLLRVGHENRMPALAVALLLPSVGLTLSLAFWLPLTWRNTEGRLEALAEDLQAAEVKIITTLLVDSPEWLGGRHPELRYVSSTSGWHDRPPFAPSRTWWTPDLRVSHWRFLEQKLLPILHRAGVPLLLGTDAMGFPLIIPGISVHGELALLHQAGLTPFEALRAATVLPTRFLHQNLEGGTIEPGLQADLLLVDGNPLEDLSYLERPAAVVLQGRWLDGAFLRDQLEALAEESRPERRSLTTG